MTILTNPLLDGIEEKTNLTLTQNNAVAYKSTLDRCLDLFARAGGLRDDPTEALVLFKLAYQEHPLNAMKTLFHIRDIREGMGERRIFRACMDWLLSHDLDTFLPNLYLFAEYGRWDDLVRYAAAVPEVSILLKNQLEADIWNKDREPNNPISLLARWMPSLSASNPQQRQLAKDITKGWKWKQKDYRKPLAKLRSHIDIVEKRMCTQDWGRIDFSKVPSQAMLKLKGAFFRNDEKRFKRFLESVAKGDQKINAGTITPDQLIKAYVVATADTSINPWNLYEDDDNFGRDDNALAVLAAQWNALPTWGSQQDMLVVADVSGSMFDRFDSIWVSVALALYTAENNCSHMWQNRFLTFSGTPELITIPDGATLEEKIKLVTKADWGMNTNLIATTDLVFNVATCPGDLPDAIVVVSDMEFDQAVSGESLLVETRSEESNAVIKQIKANCEAKFGKGTTPNIVFWNVCSRTSQLAADKNEDGVALVSGRSPSILKMAFNGQFDPLRFYQEAVLTNQRYAHVSLA